MVLSLSEFEAIMRKRFAIPEDLSPEDEEKTWGMQPDEEDSFRDVKAFANEVPPSPDVPQAVNSTLSGYWATIADEARKAHPLPDTTPVNTPESDAGPSTSPELPQYGPVNSPDSSYKYESFSRFSYQAPSRWSTTSTSSSSTIRARPKGARLSTTSTSSSSTIRASRYSTASLRPTTAYTVADSDKTPLETHCEQAEHEQPELPEPTAEPEEVKLPELSELSERAEQAELAEEQSEQEHSETDTFDWDSPDSDDFLSDGYRSSFYASSASSRTPPDTPLASPPDTPTLMSTRLGPRVIISPLDTEPPIPGGLPDLPPKPTSPASTSTSASAPQRPWRGVHWKPRLGLPPQRPAPNKALPPTPNQSLAPVPLSSASSSGSSFHSTFIASRPPRLPRIPLVSSPILQEREACSWQSSRPAPPPPGPAGRSQGLVHKQSSQGLSHKQSQGLLRKTSQGLLQKQGQGLVPKPSIFQRVPRVRGARRPRVIIPGSTPRPYMQQRRESLDKFYACPSPAPTLLHYRPPPPELAVWPLLPPRARKSLPSPPSPQATTPTAHKRSMSNPERGWADSTGVSNGMTYYTSVPIVEEPASCSEDTSASESSSKRESVAEQEKAVPPRPKRRAPPVPRPEELEGLLEELLQPSPNARAGSLQDALAGTARLQRLLRGSTISRRAATERFSLPAWGKIDPGCSWEELEWKAREDSVRRRPEQKPRGPRAPRQSWASPTDQHDGDFTVCIKTQYL